jgi:toxin ParE1/3/4
VAKRPRLQVHVTGPARRDINAIVKWSFQEFGEAAARRYEALIQQALCDVGSDPERPGSKERPDLMIEGARTYHLEFSRSRVSGPSVKEPRHFLLYRRRADGTVEVAPILHDGRDLARHLPEGYRR